MAGHDGNREEDSGLKLGAMLAVARRRIWVIVACTLIAGGAALTFSLLQTEQYDATSSLLFRDTGFDSSFLGGQAAGAEDADRQAATNLSLVTLDAVAALAAAELDGDLTGSEVSAGVTVASEGSSNIISITATDPDPQLAADLANAFATSYVAFRKETDRNKVAEVLALIRREFQDLNARQRASQEGQDLALEIGRLRTLRALQTGNAEVVQTASVPTSPSIPRTRRNLALGLFIGFLIGIGTAYVLERSDRRLRSVDQLEGIQGTPLLATVPESGTLEQGTSTADSASVLPMAEAEAFRMLRTRLRYFNVDREVKVVLATSASQGEGKSTVSWNLAAIVADAGGSTLLIETDFRRPTAAKRHGLAPSPGLTELLSKQAGLDEAIQKAPVQAISTSEHESAAMDVITAGAPPPSPIDLLGSKQLQTTLDELRQRYDLIVVDTPPILTVADAIPLTTIVDGVLVVVSIGLTTSDDLDRVLASLADFDAPVLGLVANRVAEGAGYYYY